MEVAEIMTKSPACARLESPLQEVARMMVENDCGAIPVVEDEDCLRPVGIITDRDITIRTVAQGANPLELTASDCMTCCAITVSPDATVEEVADVMADFHIRRVPVVDDEGHCVGMVAQADIAETLSAQETGEVVRQVSEEDGDAVPRGGIYTAG